MMPQSAPVKVPRTGPPIAHSGQRDHIFAAGSGNVYSARDAAAIYARKFKVNAKRSHVQGS